METRPLSPERVKHFLARKAAERYAGRTASANQRGLVAGMLKKCFAEFDDADNRRHSAQFWLTGWASLTNVPDPVVLAMLDWFGPDRDEAGVYQPSESAVAEARMIEHAYLLSDESQKDSAAALLATCKARAIDGPLTTLPERMTPDEIPMGGINDIVDGADWQEQETPPHF